MNLFGIWKIVPADKWDYLRIVLPIREEQLAYYEHIVALSRKKDKDINNLHYEIETLYPP